MWVSREQGVKYKTVCEERGRGVGMSFFLKYIHTNLLKVGRVKSRGEKG